MEEPVVDMVVQEAKLRRLMRELDEIYHDIDARRLPPPPPPPQLSPRSGMIFSPRTWFMKMFQGQRRRRKSIPLHKEDQVE